MSEMAGWAVVAGEGLLALTLAVVAGGRRDDPQSGEDEAVG